MSDKSVPKSVEVVEQVQSSEVNVGDEIFFPNSRRPQKVIAITQEEIAGTTVRTIQGDGVRHALGDNTPVRRVRRDA
jgi:hypothetical protein